MPAVRHTWVAASASSNDPLCPRTRSCAAASVLSTPIVTRATPAAAKALQLRYHLQASMPARVTSPPAKAYEYYDPQKQVLSRPVELVAELPA